MTTRQSANLGLQAEVKRGHIDTAPEAPSSCGGEAPALGPGIFTDAVASAQGSGRRLFYALWPDSTVADKLVRLQDGLAGKKTHRDDFHLTLAFLGEQPTHVLPTLEAVLRGLPRPDMSFMLNCFGRFRHLDLLWVGMSEAPQALFDLQQDLVGALRSNGVAFKHESAFRPHITLARKIKTVPQIGFSPIVWSDCSLVLACSESAPGGGRYRILASRG